MQEDEASPARSCGWLLFPLRGRPLWSPTPSCSRGSVAICACALLIPHNRLPPSFPARAPSPSPEECRDDGLLPTVALVLVPASCLMSWTVPPVQERLHDRSWINLLISREDTIFILISARQIDYFSDMHTSL